MSEVKRYDMKTTYRGHESWDSLEEDKDGGYVNYEDYAALEAKCAALAALVAENAGLKAAFDKPQAYLSWHTIPPTWEDPLPCGEYLDVHDDACHKNSDGTDCWPVYAKPEINTPATDAFLAEVRAQGVDSAINTVIVMMNHQHPVTSKAIDIMRVHAYQIRKGVQS